MTKRPPLRVDVSSRDVPDFYFMVRWFAKHKGNTFHYIWHELMRIYPDIAQEYGDVPPEVAGK